MHKDDKQKIRDVRGKISDDEAIIDTHDFHCTNIAVNFSLFMYNEAWKINFLKEKSCGNLYIVKHTHFFVLRAIIYAGQASTCFYFIFSFYFFIFNYQPAPVFDEFTLVERTRDKFYFIRTRKRTWEEKLIFVRRSPQEEEIALT